MWVCDSFWRTTPEVVHWSSYTCVWAPANTYLHTKNYQNHLCLLDFSSTAWQWVAADLFFEGSWSALLSIWCFSSEEVPSRAILSALARHDDVLSCPSKFQQACWHCFSDAEMVSMPGLLAWWALGTRQSIQPSWGLSIDQCDMAILPCIVLLAWGLGCWPDASVLGQGTAGLRPWRLLCLNASAVFSEIIHCFPVIP